MRSKYTYTDQDSGEADAEFEDDIDVLRGYSFITLGSEEGYCDIHPLVQCCTRVWASRFNDLPKWKPQFLRLMLRNFPDTGYDDWPNYDIWPTWQVLLPHDSTMFEEEPSVEEDLACWNKLLENVTLYTTALLDMQRSRKLICKFTATRIKLLGDSPKRILSDMFKKGTVFLVQELYKSAEEIFIEIVKVYHEDLGNESPIILEAMAGVAECLQWTGQF